MVCPPAVARLVQVPEFAMQYVSVSRSRVRVFLHALLPLLMVVACSTTPGTLEDQRSLAQSLITGSGICRTAQMSDEWDGMSGAANEPAINSANVVRAYLPTSARLTHL